MELNKWYIREEASEDKDLGPNKRAYTYFYPKKYSDGAYFGKTVYVQWLKNKCIFLSAYDDGMEAHYDNFELYKGDEEDFFDLLPFYIRNWLRDE